MESIHYKYLIYCSSNNLFKIHYFIYVAYIFGLKTLILPSIVNNYFPYAKNKNLRTKEILKFVNFRVWLAKIQNLNLNCYFDCLLDGIEEE